LLRKGNHLEDLSVDERILKWILRSGLEIWTDLAQDSNKLWAVVFAEMYFRVPQNAGNFLTI
jgi:hypothetical protein